MAGVMPIMIRRRLDWFFMLHTSAYTLRQKARLAVSLAWVGGFVDAVGYLLLYNIFTSNMTGNTALLGARLAARNWSNALYCFMPIVFFVAGAMASGVLLESGRRHGIRSVYALALGVEALLLGVFMVCAGAIVDMDGRIQPDAYWKFFPMLGLPALAMGLQNATITQISGSVVRTTHVTGVLTDLGLETVQLIYFLRDRTRGRLLERLGMALYLSTRHTSVQRLALLISIWGSFAFGTTFGVLAMGKWSTACLIAPVSFLAFLVALDLLRPIAAVDHVDHGASDEELGRFGIDAGLLPSTIGVFRVEGRKGKKMRPPDLGRLAERAGANQRVLILIVSEHARLDENSLIGLQMSVQTLRSRDETW